MPDYVSLSILDQAIDKLSEIAGRRYTWEGNITSGDITNGYFTLSPRPVFVELPPFWSLQGSKIYLNSTVVTPQPYSLEGKTGFNRYEGVVKSDTQLDIPNDAYLGVVYYALGLYTQTNGISSVKEGTIRRKKEDGLEVEYGLDTNMADFTPKAIMQKGISFMQNLPYSQDLYFSLKI